MIEFSPYYHIRADEIVLIGVTENKDSKYPLTLTVTLRSGTTVSLGFANETAMNRERDRLLAQIDKEV